MGEVREFDKADYGLLSVRAESWGFFVFVNLDPDAAPLDEQLGDLPERFGDYRLDEGRGGRGGGGRGAAETQAVAENGLADSHPARGDPQRGKVSAVEDGR